jgi:hypothetical protein
VDRKRQSLPSIDMKKRVNDSLEKVRTRMKTTESHFKMKTSDKEPGNSN